MKVLLIQNTDKDLLPMTRISKVHVMAIQRILPLALWASEESEKKLPRFLRLST